VGEKCSDKFRLEFDFHVILEIFYVQQICDMGTDGFTSPPKEGVLRIFFALKNPTASAGFEPANLGTKGQHATSRPPKPLGIYIYIYIYIMDQFLIYRVAFVYTNTALVEFSVK
jgi:hypothetical protein